MNLELNATEAGELRHVLDGYLDSLHRRLSQTENVDFRDELLLMQERLRRIRRRLEVAEHSDLEPQYA